MPQPPNTPAWLTPSQTGMLSNTKGANAGADGILLSAQYRGPGGPSGIRVTGSRTAMNNQPLPTAQAIWESAWVGSPATSPLPVTTALGSGAALNYFGRIYLVVPSTVTPMNNCIAGILSAPVNGGNVGSWRWENPVSVIAYNGFNEPYYIQDTVIPGALCYVSDWIFVMGINGLYSAKVNADGSLGGTGVAGVASLGQWKSVFSGVWNVVTGAMMDSYQVVNTSFPGWVGKLVVLDPRSPFTLLYTFDVHDDGTVVGTSVMNATMPVQRAYGGLHVDPYGGLYVIGGEDGTGVPQSSCYKLDCNLGTNTPGSWFATTALPAARSRFGFAAQSERIAGDTDVFVCGGVQTNAGAAQSTVYTLKGSNLRLGSGTWTSYSSTLPTATSACAAAFTHWGGANHPRVEFAAPPGFPQSTYPLRADYTASLTIPQRQLVVIGGAATTAVQVSSASDFTRPWFSGPASLLTGTDLGFGVGSVVRNADGSYTLGFPYAANSQSGFGLDKVLAVLLNGDWVEIGVQFASSSTGDTSLPGITQIKIGQPPTISTAAPSGTITNGQPTASFSYVAGAGGGDLDTYQIQVTLSGTTIYDTGVRRDGLLAALLTIAPLLLPSTTYTLVITVTSRDVAMPGSSNTATSTTTFTTSAFSPLAAPANLVVTPNNLLGRMDVSWNSVASATGYRLYYRRSNTAAWYLYQDAIVPTSLSAYDHLALNASYDFAVSTLSSGPLESSLSTVDPNNTIVPPTLSPGVYSAFLHIAGLGSTYSVPVNFQAIDTSNPGYKEEILAGKILGFNQAAPIYRYGSADYHTLTPKIFLNDLTTATLKALQAVMDQVKQGQVAFWRDSVGGMLTVAFDISHQMVLLPPSYREAWLALSEVLDTVGPSVPSGSAQGYLTLASGRRPPLDTSERVL
jgi:hypothetical protein